jgi:hypothetical protein
MEKVQDRHRINSQLITSYNDIAMQNAIISEHTLYPYHFVKNSAELNELGQRDLSALASHFIKHAGHLNIRQHNTPADLYKARVNLVLERLQEAGIDMEKMSISDDMPGGSGMPSERMIVILEEEQEGTSAGTSATFKSGTR